VPSNPTPRGHEIGYFDQIGVHNQFYGPQGGCATDWRLGRLYLGGTVKTALGVMHETARLDGDTLVDARIYSGGILTQPTNMGVQSRDRFAVVPELRLDIGFQVTEVIGVFAGYNVLFISNTARAGGLIDGVDSQIVPQLHPGATIGGMAHPAFGWTESSLWVHGLTCGVELRY
jgi:hypothetical protein